TKSVSRAKHKKKVRKPKSKVKRVEKEVVKEGKIVEKELEEEFFVPSPSHRGKYRIPLGIRFLIGYLLFICALYAVSFVSGLSFPTTILFGKLVTGVRATIVNSVLMALVVFMIYGFWKRKWYTFDLSISFFAFSALNSLLSLTLFEASEIASFKKLMILSFISMLFMNLIVIWYILHERKYFFAKRFKDRPVKQRDRVFMYAIVTFWVVALLVGSTLGMQFYNESKVLVDDAIMKLSGQVERGEEICDAEFGAQKDVCYLVLATAKNMRGLDASRYCDNIGSDFYKFACMRTVN
ncbi:hypothetical protein ACFL0V_06530, partial [Nanoarchaeota archaeon]